MNINFLNNHPVVSNEICRHISDHPTSRPSMATVESFSTNEHRKQITYVPEKDTHKNRVHQKQK